jgi:hypothetical protein
MESVSGRSSGLPVARLPLDGEVVQLCGYFGANAFGRGESFGIFALAPTIKPAGEYFTGARAACFATYSVWRSDSLKGTTTPTGED